MFIAVINYIRSFLHYALYHHLNHHHYLFAQNKQ